MFAGQIKKHMPWLPGMPDGLYLIGLPTYLLCFVVKDNCGFVQGELNTIGKTADLITLKNQLHPSAVWPAFLFGPPRQVRLDQPGGIKPIARPRRHGRDDRSNQNKITHGTSLLAKYVTGTSISQNVSQASNVNTSPLTYTIPDIDLPSGDLWVFGYGSVMWRPGFDHMERRAARVFGYHRALCVWSWFHRGTQDNPGLVLGLDVGGSCHGIAYRIAALEKAEVADYLYRRELVTDGYQALLHPVHLEDGAVTALTFRANRRHPQYAGRLDHGHAANVVRDGQGASGANPEYLAAAVQQLQQMGIPDKNLHKIHNLVADLVVA